jgi:hypothetical protein
MNKEITLTPEGGRFYRAMTFHWVTVIVCSMFNWVEGRVNRFSRWRNHVKYHIYLGCDPKVWHTLKGDL